jgi:hypothetical protein
MNELEYMKLREEAWRRPLTADEKRQLQSYLLVHADAHADWEEEAALTQLLARVPDARLSSNFTARVIQAIELEQLHAQRKGILGFRRLRSWLPRLAITGLVVGLGTFGYQGYRHRELQQQRTQYLDTLAVAAATLPPKVWDDFDAIVSLGPPISSAKDDVLWAALDTSTP